MTPLELQLNGYGGVDFNTDDLSLPAMQKACAALKADGGGRMLATVITDQLDRMVARIERLAEFHAADAHIRDAIAGIHVEGPFISPLPGYVGAHPAKHVLPAEVSAAQRLVDAGRGLVRMLTLAPEHGSGRTEVRNCRTRELRRLQARVAAGRLRHQHGRAYVVLLSMALSVSAPAWLTTGLVASWGQRHTPRCSLWKW